MKTNQPLENIPKIFQNNLQPSFTKQHTTMDIFDQMLNSKTIFISRETLRSTHIPEVLLHREIEIKKLAAILAPALKHETPSNILVFGKPGTGKTATNKHIGKQLEKRGTIHYIHINCQFADTHYRVLQHIGNHFTEKHIPFTGLPIDEVYNQLLSLIDKEKHIVIVTLDEVDKLKGDEAIYTLTRINDDLKKAKVSLICISNNLRFTEFMDPRAKSSLGEETIVFSPYNAEQLQDILKARVYTALKPNTLNEDVIPLCAALAAQEHGDARRALDLLRTSAELAERNGDTKIMNRHVRLALNNIETDHLSEAVHNLPDQSKLILYAIYTSQKHNKKAGMLGATTTGESYNIYQDLCKRTHYNVLTQRRTTDLISELDSLGIVTARIISKGRYGRTREIKISMSPQELISILQEDDFACSLFNFKIKDQARLF